MNEPSPADDGRTLTERVNDAPMSFDEMAFALGVASAAAQGMPNVGSVDGLRLADTGLHRAMKAIKEAFSHDQAKEESASYRVFFFSHVMEWPEAKPFVRRDGDSMVVHPGLIEAMGRCSFSSESPLPRRQEFCALLEECVTKHEHGRATKLPNDA